ncbi:MAG: LysM peptidoglycan-binding domain-containing protein [Planctomycetota bacterium]|nr:MAG: LysM peptidoglycan-binding domain-containing protein [Planctomycetota bacterium]
MMRTVRFLTGLVMVVTGVSLAAPMATRLVEAHRGAANGVESEPQSASAGPAAWAGAGPVSAPGPARAGGYCIPDARSAVVGAPDGAAPQEAVGLPLPADDLHAPSAGYQPPPPPDVLPASPTDLTLAPPAFNSTYRSTLDVPPPPLLDVSAPAPLAVSTPTRDGQTMLAMGQMSGGGMIRTVSAEIHPVPLDTSFSPGAGSVPVAITPAASAAPSQYTIRDGDDLTSIATRLYGHPGAAEAIWSANRDRLADPAVLPIGLSLRIPPTWVPPAVRQRGLAGGGAPIEPASRPARVRVAPGESLESLAERFYGDRAMAARLWEANRDQLRSPALLVAGMDLRLP